MKYSSTKVLLGLVMIFSSMSSCRLEEDGASNVITVSILPFSYFVEEIAGDAYNINVIVPPGASPATYEPPPSVIRSLSNSKAVIYNGYLGFEMAWMDKLKVVNPDIETLFLAEGQDLIAAEAHRHGDHYHYSGVDPHFWVSPQSALLISHDILDFLLKVFPEDEETFNNNYNVLVEEIESVKEYADSSLSDLEIKKFLIFHPALAYLARDYALEQVALEYEGKEPSAAWLSKIIEIARAEGIKVVLVQEEFNKSSAMILANELEGSAVDIFPLSDNWPEATRKIIDAIADASSK